jgi:hypothetical protein
MAGLSLVASQSSAMAANSPLISTCSSPLFGARLIVSMSGRRRQAFSHARRPFLYKLSLALPTERLAN